MNPYPRHYPRTKKPARPPAARFGGSCFPPPPALDAPGLLLSFMNDDKQRRWQGR